MVEVINPNEPALRRILDRHPEVQLVDGVAPPGIHFQSNGWRRDIDVANPICEVRGLIELMDNNPLVCADLASVPSPAATLALIALGPAFHSGIVLEPPTISLNCPVEEGDVHAYLETAGWNLGAVIDSEKRDLEGVLAATAIAVVQTPSKEAEISGLYAEVYSRCFYIWEDSQSEWHIQLVQNKPHAIYRTRLIRGDDSSLLTIQVMADKEGKCGAAQQVHMFNVMCGFEENMGIEG